MACISEMLVASVRLTEKVQQGRSLVVEDDGFTSFALISLTMLMSDPYYRTIAGFQVLIEHVWIRYGFPFASSFGFGSATLQASTDVRTRAVFIHFIDCVWQMLAQFGVYFEFNEHFLLEILEAVTSGRFGTFLCDCEKDAIFNIPITMSFWKYISDNHVEFVNPWYNQDLVASPLLPDATLLRVTFWTSYHLQWLSCNGAYQCSTLLEKFTSNVDKTEEPRTLELSHLLLSKFPLVQTLGECVGIDLSSNVFCTIPKELSALRQLETLDLSNNMIKYLPPDLIETLSESLESLTSIDLRENQLTVIDDSLQKFPKLTSLQLGGSGTFSSKLPPSLFLLENLHTLAIEGFKLIAPPDDLHKLTNLKRLSLAENCLLSLSLRLKGLEVLNLRRNQLTANALQITECEQSLTSLDISFNRLDRFPQPLFIMKELSKLMINNNAIPQISPYIRLLEKLTLLDISHNQIVEIPILLGSLSQLQTFRFKDNAITFPEKKVLSQTTGAILKSLRDMVGKKESVRRVRMMIVGQENVGKSSISHALRTGTPATVNISTDGIYVNQWKVQLPNGKAVDTEVWDFAGQEIYYTTHQLFLSDQAIYFIVWNILDNEEDTKLHYWLESIKIMAQGAPTILVATHIDQELKEKAHVTLNRIASKYHQRFPFIKAVTAVSCSTCAGFPELQERLQEVLASQSFLEAVIPCKYQFFERQMLWERSRRRPPVIPLSEYTEIAALFSIEGDEIQEVSKLLHNWGAILYYEESHLKDMVTLDPRWLIQLLSELITTKHRYIKQGIVEHADLIQIWHPSDYPLDLHRSLLQILRKFEIAFPSAEYRTEEEWQAGSSIVPSALPLKPDLRVSQIFPRFETTKQYARDYRVSFVPAGFLNFLIIRLMEQLIDVHYWRYGISGFSNTVVGAKLLVELDAESLLRVVARGDNSMSVFLMAVDIIESFIEHWIHLDVIKSVPCPHCFQECSQSPYSFPYTLCKEAALSAESYLDCRSGSSVRLDLLVPDLSMAEVTRLNYDEIEIIKEIGKGGFATVYKANYKGKQVALKKIDIVEGSTAVEVFNDFIRETWIMNGIQHRNIIGFHGLCTTPLCIMTDFAAFGNLYDFLHNEEHRVAANSWPLKLRIALDIAEGMRFLHNRVPTIIHSDLKSPNVLLHSIDPKSEVVAVVADFGLSKSWVPVLQGRQEIGRAHV